MRAGRSPNAILNRKKLTYAFHPVFDLDPAVNRCVAYVALQRRLGVLSQRRPGSYFADRVAGRFAALVGDHQVAVGVLSKIALEQGAASLAYIQTTLVVLLSAALSGLLCAGQHPAKARC